jgi:hypothetical protein
MKLDKMQVVMLEILKSAKMEHDENRHNLAIGHTRRTPSADLALGTQKRHIFNFFFIFLLNSSVAQKISIILSLVIMSVSLY